VGPQLESVQLGRYSMQFLDVIAAVLNIGDPILDAKYCCFELCENGLRAQRTDYGSDYNRGGDERGAKLHEMLADKGDEGCPKNCGRC